MANDSTAAGYLAPIPPLPLDDEPLEDVLQGPIVGITGIPGPLVRPRWQPEPPSQPDFMTNWCAFGIVRTSADVNSFKSFDPANEGAVVVERDIELDVLHSFYGPNCHSLCEIFRAGLELDQNRAVLRSYGVVLKEVKEAVNLPALLKEKWVKRIDVTVVYRARPSYIYQVRSILSGQLGLDNEYWLTPLSIINP